MCVRKCLVVEAVKVFILDIGNFSNCNLFVICYLCIVI